MLSLGNQKTIGQAILQSIYFWELGCSSTRFNVCICTFVLFYNNLSIEVHMCIYWGVNYIPHLKLCLFGKFCTGIIYCNNFDKDFVLWQMSSGISLTLSLFSMYNYVDIHAVSTWYCMTWPTHHSTIGKLCICKAWIDGKW